MCWELRPASAAALILALVDPEVDLRARAAEILGLLGADAREAQPALERARRDRAPQVAAAARHALVLIADSLRQRATPPATAPASQP